jgi:hypothetical protein
VPILPLPPSPFTTRCAAQQRHAPCSSAYARRCAYCHVSCHYIIFAIDYAAMLPAFAVDCFHFIIFDLARLLIALLHRQNARRRAPQRGMYAEVTQQRRAGGTQTAIAGAQAQRA